jgi:hypothetical protein
MIMKKEPRDMAINETEDTLRPEYDLNSLRVRRMGAARKDNSRLTVTLDDDVALVFTTPEDVNRALRALLSAFPPQRKSA